LWNEDDDEFLEGRIVDTYIEESINDFKSLICHISVERKVFKRHQPSFLN